jgi:hypothetical protein
MVGFLRNIAADYLTRVRENGNGEAGVRSIISDLRDLSFYFYCGVKRERTHQFHPGRRGLSDLIN